MNDKNRKKKQEQELATNRMLVIFVFVIAVLYGMKSLYNVMTFGSTFLQGRRINGIVLLISAVGAAAFLAVGPILKKQGKLKTDKIFTPFFIAFLFAVLALSALVLRVEIQHGMDILYVALPVLAVLYLVNLVYERQFLTFCVVEAAAIGAAYCSYRGAWERFPMTVIAVVLSLVPLVLVLVDSKSLKEIKRMILGRQADKRFIVALCCVTIALVALAMILGGKVALILTVALGAVLLGTAVYYTVKAM